MGREAPSRRRILAKAQSPRRTPRKKGNGGWRREESCRTLNSFIRDLILNSKILSDLRVLGVTWRLCERNFIKSVLAETPRRRVRGAGIRYLRLSIID